jgi:predicted ATP-grasp superfamily ATP-dependent carboligase
MTAFFDLSGGGGDAANWFRDRIVFTPCLSVADAGQVACAELTSSAQLTRIGALEHRALVPLTYAIDNGAHVALPCEVYASSSSSAVVVQRRAPTRGFRGASRQFAADLVDLLAASQSRALVLALSIDHGSLDNAHRRPLVFATDAALRAKLATFGALPVDNIAVLSASAGTFSRHAHAAAVARGLPFVIVAVPVAEGAGEAEQIRPLGSLLANLLQ